MFRTYQTKSTKDFSTWFIFLRIIGNSIWISYAINIDSLQMLINNCVTVFASLFISYYKCRELYADYTERKQLTWNDEYTALNDDTILDTIHHTDELLKQAEEEIVSIKGYILVQLLRLQKVIFWSNCFAYKRLYFGPTFSQKVIFWSNLF
jgi:hypothetical protein